MWTGRTVYLAVWRGPKLKLTGSPDNMPLKALNCSEFEMLWTPLQILKVFPAFSKRLVGGQRQGNRYLKWPLLSPCKIKDYQELCDPGPAYSFKPVSWALPRGLDLPPLTAYWTVMLILLWREFPQINSYYSHMHLVWALKEPSCSIKVSTLEIPSLIKSWHQKLNYVFIILFSVCLK